MPLSDEERLERVYAKAASMRLARRARVMGVAVAMLVLASGMVLANSDSDGGGSRVELAGPADDTSSTTMPETTETTAVTTTTTSTSTTTALPAELPVTTTSIPPVPSTTSTTTPYHTENCGGAFGYAEQPPPPEGMTVTIEASKSKVRRGEEIVLTMRARWNGSEPYSHVRHAGNFIYVHFNGNVQYSTQYDDTQEGFQPEETFQPGEEKTYTTTWNTGQACGPGGMRDAKLRPGVYTVEGQWAAKDSTWHPTPDTFELTE